MAKDPVKTLTELVLSLPGMDPQKLGQGHHDDGNGRCACCASNGARVTWPCTIYSITASAKQSRKSR